MANQINTCIYSGCKLPVHSPHDENYCLGHAPIENKNCTQEEFNSFLINEKLRHNDFNFEGFKFPSLNLESRIINSNFQSEVNFRDCEFYKTNDKDEEFSFTLVNKTFQKKVDFTGSKFFAGVQFQNCRFHSECNFTNVLFKGVTLFLNGSQSKLIFNRAIFYKSFNIKMEQGMGELLFENETTFKEELIIEKQKFNQKVEFNNVTFNKHLAICGSEFFQNSGFTNCIFKSSNFLGTTFHKLCSFIRSRFSGNVLFDFHFNDKTDFSFVEFNGTTNFDKAEFHSEVSWGFSTFKKVSFNCTKFYDNCKFSDSVFYDSATFQNTVFKSLANFSSTQFLIGKDNPNSLIHFNQTEFHSKADFEGNHILGNLTFSRIIWVENSLLSFANTVFIGDSRLLFENINFRPFKTIFENIKVLPNVLSHPLSIIFRNCDLKDVFFTNNNLSYFSFYKSTFDNAIFNSNEWNGHNERLLIFHYKRKNVIFEDSYNEYDFSIPPNDKYAQKRNYYLNDLAGLEEIASLYRRFKVALDNSKDYEQAGWFYFNEYEMKRRACLEDSEKKRKYFKKKSEFKNKSKSKYFLYSFYKLFAGYGEKPLWSLYWLIFSTFIFSVINLFNGIKFNGKEIFNYDWEFSFQGVVNIINLSWFLDFVKSVAFTISRIIPLGYLPIPKEQFTATTPTDYIISIANTIVLLFFLTFIAVGLKRIFRRF